MCFLIVGEWSCIDPYSKKRLMIIIRADQFITIRSKSANHKGYNYSGNFSARSKISCLYWVLFCVKTILQTLCFIPLQTHSQVHVILVLVRICQKISLDEFQSCATLVIKLPDQCRTCTYCKWAQVSLQMLLNTMHFYYSENIISTVFVCVCSNFRMWL